jgi:hypothetical protein
VNRRWIYLGFVLLAAALIWWTGSEDDTPPARFWDRPGGPLPGLVRTSEPWGLFAEVALREAAGLKVSAPSLSGPTCEVSGHDSLRVLSAWTADGWLHLALSPVDRSSCPALEVLLLPAGGGGPRVNARALLGSREPVALRNPRGRVTLSRAGWDGEFPLALEVRLQGEDADGRPTTLEATFSLEVPP